MKELSLHILDIAQNSLSAGAANVEIIIRDSESSDEMKITIKDDGRGMSQIFLATVTDPFTTTRTTRNVGMGLPLFKLAAEQSGGGLEIVSEEGHGTTVTARFVNSSIDRPPLGDMAGTIVTLVQGAPEKNFYYQYQTDEKDLVFDTKEIRETLEGVPLDQPEVLVWIEEYIK